MENGFGYDSAWVEFGWRREAVGAVDVENGRMGIRLRMFQVFRERALPHLQLVRMKPFARSGSSAPFSAPSPTVI